MGYTSNISTGNSKPIANAGPDQTVYLAQTVNLNGSGSSDVDGNSLTFAWSFTSRPQESSATLSDLTAINPTFVADKLGEYVVQLIVNDGTVNSNPYAVKISTENSKPVANAGPDQSVHVTQTVHLDGSGSNDVDGDPLTYFWSITSKPTGSTAALSAADIVSPTFVADITGDYVIQLIVNDGSVNSGPDTVLIAVSVPPNRAPIAVNDAYSTDEDATLIVGGGSGVLGNDSDPDGNPITAVLANNVTHGVLTLKADGSFTYAPYSNYSGADSFTYRATDGLLESNIASVTITVRPANKPPVVNAGPDQTIMLPMTSTLSGTVLDDGLPAGASLAVNWSKVSGPGTVIFSNPDSTSTNSIFSTAGSYVLKLTASDSLLAASDEVTITVNPEPNPAVISVNPNSGKQGQKGISVNIVGENTHFVNGSTTADFGSGVKVVSIAVNSAVSATVVVDIENNAPVGPRSITLTSGKETASLADAFSIQLNSAPTILSTPPILDYRWGQLFPDGLAPSPRYVGSGDSYDEQNDRLIVFSGFNQTTHQVYPRPADVWIISNASGTNGKPSWSQLAPVGNTPLGRELNIGVYDSSSNRFIIQGGCGGNCSPTLYDTWVLTNANGIGGTPAWIQLPDFPVSRQDHSAVLDVASNRLIVFAGWVYPMVGNSNDVWILRDANGIGNPEWIKLNPVGTPPPPRVRMQAAYDPATNRMIAFGGMRRPDLSTGPSFNDVWVLTNANGLGGTPEWIKLSPLGTLPEGRGAFAVTYDTATNQMTIIGGCSEAPQLKFYDDVWILKNANGLGGTPEWVKLDLETNHQIARAYHLAGYEPNSDRIIMSMGRDDLYFPLKKPWVSYNDLWVIGRGMMEGQSYTYKVSAADPDDIDALTFSLDKAPEGMTIDPKTGRIDWTPAAGQADYHKVIVRVTDSAERYATQSFRIGVFRINAPPIVNAGADQTINYPSIAMLNGTVSDDNLPPGAPVSVAWSLFSGPVNVTFGSPDSISTTVAFSQPGTYILRLTATDTHVPAISDVVITVNPAGSVPQISQVSPSFGVQGQQNVSVNITGLNTNFVPGITQASFGAYFDKYIKVESVVVLSPSIITAHISIPADMPVNRYSITVTTGSEVASIASAFNVLEMGTPVLLSIDPNGGYQGQKNLSVTITGLSTAFVQGDSQASFGEGIVVGAETVSSPTTLTAQISIASDAVLGPRTVVVVTDSGQATFANGFTVEQVINQPPKIAIQSTWNMTLPSQLTVTYAVTDDGLPIGGTLTFLWNKVSGPGTVTFSEQSSVSTTAIFSSAGTYVLRLTVSDSQLAGSSDVTVTVLPAPVNKAPVVNAGPDRTIAPGTTAELFGTVTDDGFPVGGALGVMWMKVSGPGSVIFGKPDATSTTITVCEAGTYQLRLAASDSELIGSDDIVITVIQGNQPPVVGLSRNYSVLDMGRGATGSLMWTALNNKGQAAFSSLDFHGQLFT